MALIRCRECGKQISDLSRQCQGCGAPVTRGRTTATSIKIPITKIPHKLSNLAQKKKRSQNIITSNDNYSLQEVYTVLKKNLKQNCVKKIDYHGSSISLIGETFYMVIVKHNDELYYNIKFKSFIWVLLIVTSLFTFVFGLIWFLVPSIQINRLNKRMTEIL